MNRPEGGARILWLALVMLTSVVASACAAVLFWILGAGAVAAASAAGASFIGVATVGLGAVALLSSR